MVSRPTVIYDKGDMDNPHDDLTIMIDDNGYIWVFVSGRGNKRKGIKLRSNEPYDINAFTQVSTEVFATPRYGIPKMVFPIFYQVYRGQGIVFQGF
jgi:hypothetical protein